MYQIWRNMDLWVLSGLNLCCWVHVCSQIVQLTSSRLKRRHPEYKFRFILLTDVFPQSKTDLRLVNCLNVFLPGGKREGRQVNKQRLFENYFASQLSFSLQIFFFSSPQIHNGWKHLHRREATQSMRNKRDYYNATIWQRLRELFSSGEWAITNCFQVCRREKHGGQEKVPPLKCRSRITSIHAHM